MNEHSPLPRLLTFNHHEPFLVALADLQASIDVVVRKGSRDLSWNARARKPPSHFRLIDFDEAVAGLRAGSYHAVISHTVKNLGWLLPFKGVRHVFVAHIPLFQDSLAAQVRSAMKKATVVCFGALHDLSFVAVSEWKRASWNLEGTVTPFYPVPFPAEKTSSRKDPDALVAVVGNRIASRGDEMGLHLLEQVRARTALEIIGDNSDMEGARVPRDFDDFVRLFTSCSLYLYTIRQPHGDGYNTSMLEAMELGMPVVTVPNASSPIVDGVNGLVGDSAEELVRHIETLKRDPELREHLGTAARETVRAHFSKKEFLRKWSEVLRLNA